jgi:hypothetical protein
VNKMSRERQSQGTQAQIEKPNKPKETEWKEVDRVLELRRVWKLQKREYPDGSMSLKLVVNPYEWKRSEIMMGGLPTPPAGITVEIEEDPYAEYVYAEMSEVEQKAQNGQEEMDKRPAKIARLEREITKSKAHLERAKDIARLTEKKIKETQEKIDELQGEIQETQDKIKEIRSKRVDMDYRQHRAEPQNNHTQPEEQPLDFSKQPEEKANH